MADVDQALSDAQVAAGKAHMHSLAMLAQNYQPDATAVVLSESDQGDWLDVAGFLGADSDPDVAYDFDDDGEAMSLYTDVYVLRELYAKYDVRGDIEYSDKMGLRSFHMDIAKVLAELAPTKRPRYEILHTRDPDSDCGVRLWVDGQEVDAQSIYMDDIDPGRGYDDETWEENVEYAREADTSPSFKEAVLASYKGFKSVQQKWSL